jgi:hypothetical protein
MDIQDIFYGVASEVRAIELSSSPVSLDVLKTLLKRFEKDLSKAGDDILPEFIDYHYNEIARISRVMQTIKDPVITGYHDRIFKNTFGMTKRVPTNLTRVFEAFIRGVTLFYHQLPEDPVVFTPVYHRLQACGPGDDAFRKEYQQCTDLMDTRTRADVRQRIQTCYIERLIYNELYKVMSLHFPIQGTDGIEQDEGHRYRLDLVREDFKTCFPNLDIEISVDFDMHLPVSLTIVRKIRGATSSTETYTRTLVFDPVFGGKKYTDDVQVVRKTDKYTYTHVQTFTNNRSHWCKTPNDN